MLTNLRRFSGISYSEINKIMLSTGKNSINPTTQ